jgi:PAS domain S-box-containing protein
MVDLVPGPRSGNGAWEAFPGIADKYRYGLGLLGALAALGLREALNSVLGPNAPYMPFALAIVLVARVCGRGPALLASAIGTLSVDLFFIRPYYSLRLSDPGAVAGLALFAIVAVLISITVGSLRESHITAARAEERLRRQARMIELSHDAVITADEKRRITGWNAGAEEIYGWTAAEAEGKVIHDLLQTKGPIPVSEIDRLVQRDGRWDGELVHTRKNGRQIVTESRHVLVSGDDGARGILEINRDITERRASEDALRESERRVQKKLAAILSPDGDVAALELQDVVDTNAIQSLMDDFHKLVRIPLAFLDTQGNVLVKAGWQDICTQFHRVHPETLANCIESDTELTQGVPPGEHKIYRCKNNLCDVATPFAVGGRHLGNIFTGQFILGDDPVDEQAFSGQAARYGFDQSKYLQALQRVPRVDKDTVSTAIDFLRKFGELVGKLSYANIQLARYLTKLKQAQESVLQLSEQRGLALEAANLGAWNYSVDTGDVFWDERCRQMFGFTSEGRIHIGEALARIHSDDRPGVEDAIRNAVKGVGEGKYDREFRVVFPDGTSRWIASHGHVFFHGQAGERRPIRFVGVNMDITERRNTEEALRQKQKLESIGLLAGGVAHDFNNLLTVVVGSASDALEECPNCEHAQAILSSAERAAFLTKQLLAYAGKGTFVKKLVNLSDLVSQSTALLSASVPKRVRLTFDLSDGLPYLEADPSQIEQILMNFVGNAGEAIPAKTEGLIEIGTSAVDVSAETARRESSAYHIEPGRFVRLQVRDNGSGMDEGTIARIFDPFFTTKFTGRGLGLAAVYGLVRAAKGFLEVRSKLNEGACFAVYLPASEKKPQTALPPVLREQPARGTGTVLVVEDEEMVRKLACLSLRRHGYEVLEARDAKQALDVMAKASETPSAAILDLAMSVMGGDELASILHATYPGIRIILTSGYPEEEARKISHSVVTDFLQKPYTGVTLAQKVARTLKGE